MKRFAITLLLVLISGSAVADWAQVGDTDEYIIYADRTSIRKSGAIVKMWNMEDYKAAQLEAHGKAYLSVKEQREYDCQGERTRVLAFSMHSGHLGRGTTVEYESFDGQWQPNSPQSLGALLWQVACRQR